MIREVWGSSPSFLPGIQRCCLGAQQPSCHQEVGDPTWMVGGDEAEAGSSVRGAGHLVRAGFPCVVASRLPNWCRPATPLSPERMRTARPGLPLGGGHLQGPHWRPSTAWGSGACSILCPPQGEGKRDRNGVTGGSPLLHPQRADRGARTDSRWTGGRRGSHLSS